MYHSTPQSSCPRLRLSSNYISRQGSPGVRGAESGNLGPLQGLCGVHRGKTGQVRLAKDKPQEPNVWARSVGCYSEGNGVLQEDFKRGMTWSELYLWKLPGSSVKLEERGQLGDWGSNLNGEKRASLSQGRCEGDRSMSR